MRIVVTRPEPDVPETLDGRLYTLVTQVPVETKCYVFEWATTEDTITWWGWNCRGWLMFPPHTTWHEYCRKQCDGADISVYRAYVSRYYLFQKQAIV